MSHCRANFCPAMAWAIRSPSTAELKCRPGTFLQSSWTPRRMMKAYWQQTIMLADIRLYGFPFVQQPSTVALIQPHYVPRRLHYERTIWGGDQTSACGDSKKLSDLRGCHPVYVDKPPSSCHTAHYNTSAEACHMFPQWRVLH